MSSKFFTFNCGCKLPIISENPLRIDFDPDVRTMPLDCPRTWELYAEKNMKGVFQLERNLGRAWAGRVKPRSIAEASDLIAIIRPGCLEAKLEDGKTLTEHYVMRKDGMEPVTYLHPCLEPILKETYGILVYQEQSMAIARAVAGFGLQEADNLRKIISKKKPELMAKIKVDFINGAKNFGVVQDEVASQIFDWIEKSQKYSFCKSHSIVYAAGGYASAYAKAHLVRPFFTSYLNSAHDGSDGFAEVKELVNNAKMNQIEVRVPDFRLGNTYFKLVDKVIYFGLSEIKGIGDGSINKLEEVAKQVESSIGVWRADWTWADIIIYLEPLLNKTCMEALICCGAFDYLKYGRSRMDYEYKIWKGLKDKKGWQGLTKKESDYVRSFYNRKKHKTASALFDDLLTSKVGNGKECGISNNNRYEKIAEQAKLLKRPPYSLEDTAEWISEKELFLLGTAVTCTKVEGCDTTRATHTCEEFNGGSAANKFCIAVNIDRVSEYEIKSGKSKGRLMAFMDVFDITGYVSCVVFSDLYYKSCSMLTEGNTILVSGKRDSKKDSLVIENIWQL